MACGVHRGELQLAIEGHVICKVTNSAHIQLRYGSTRRGNCRPPLLRRLGFQRHAVPEIRQHECTRPVRSPGQWRIKVRGLCANIYFPDRVVGSPVVRQAALQRHRLRPPCLARRVKRGCIYRRGSDFVSHAHWCGVRAKYLSLISPSHRKT